MVKKKIFQEINPERSKTLKMTYFVVKIKAGILGVKKGSKGLNKRGWLRGTEKNFCIMAPFEQYASLKKHAPEFW